MKYYKSLTPGVSVYASGGQVIKWTTVDGSVGWYATDRKQNIDALARCIERKVGGAIVEIDEAEYSDLVGKAKGAPRFTPDREHLSADGLYQPQRVPPAQLPGGPVVADSEKEPVAESSDSDSLSAVPAEPEIRKRGGRVRKT